MEKKEYLYKEITNTDNIITIHKGPPNKLKVKLEKEIYNWIFYNRELGNPITTLGISIETLKRDHSFKKNSAGIIRTS